MTAYDSPDYLGVVPFGAALILSGLIVPVAGGVIHKFGPVAVGAASLVIVSANQDGASPVQWSLSWSSDPAGVNTLTPNPVSAKNTNLGVFAAFPVAGPYLTVFLNNTGGVSSTVSLEVFATGAAVEPADMFPPGDLINVQNIAVGASASVVNQPTLHVPGRAKLWALLTQAGTVRLREWNGTAWVIFWQQNVPVNGIVDAEVVVPLNDWDVVFINTNAVAGNGYVCMVAPA